MPLPISPAICADYKVREMHTQSLRNVLKYVFFDTLTGFGVLDRPLAASSFFSQALLGPSLG
jgi:hypothetical protein